MARVILSDAANEDLERIGEHLRRNAPDHALDTIHRMADAIAVLERHPLIGRRDGERRELVIGHGPGYLALYRYDLVREVVLVLRIRDQAESGYRD